MKKHIFLCIIAGFISWQAQGQFDINIISPEAAKLVNVVNNPVDYNRGLVNTEIPLFELKIDGVVIPFTLSYHHGGVKLNEFNQWLGQGWNINPFLSIAKVINGREDRNDFYTSPNEEKKRNFDYMYNMIHNKGAYDEEPDEYYYSLFGKNGLFMYDKVKEPGSTIFSLVPVTVPYEQVKISKSGQGYSIVDENGWIYNFGTTGGEYDKEKYYDSTDKAYKINGWKCNSVRSPLSNEGITFEYRHYCFDERKLLNNYVELEDCANEFQGKDRDKNPGADLPGLYRYSGDNINKSFNAIYYRDPQLYPEAEPIVQIFENTTNEFNSLNPLPTTSIRTYYMISAIYHPDGTVNFSVNSQGSLTSITLINTKGEIIKSIEFINRYVKVVYQQSQTYPILESLSFRDSYNQIVEKYNFEYNGDNFPSDIDVWGNGVDFNRYSSHIPALGDIDVYYNTGVYPAGKYIVKWRYEIGSVNRLNKASDKGMLTAVTNSLGRRTEFTYESHYYKYGKRDDPNNPFSVLKTVVNGNGGLRIRQVRHIDTEDSSTVTHIYKYGNVIDRGSSDFFSAPVNKQDDEDGLGIIKREIHPESFMTAHRKVLLNEYSVDTETRLRCFYPFLFGNSTFNGIPVVYKRVTEYEIKTKNGVVTNNGKTVYYYDFPDGPWDMVEFSANDNNDFSHRYFDYKTNWGIGQILKKEVYSGIAGRNEYIIRNRTEYEYENKNYGRITGARVYEKTKFQKKGDPYFEAKEQAVSLYGFYFSNVYEYYTYSIPLSNMKIKKEKETRFTSEQHPGYVTKEYIYESEHHFYPTVIREIYNDETEIKRYLKYPQDKGANTQTEHLGARNELLSRNILNPVLEEKTENYAGYVTTWNSYKLFNNLPFLYKQMVGKNISQPEETVRCDQYDYYGNPGYIIRDNTEKNVYIWSYAGRYPVFIIKNASYSEVLSALSFTAAQMEAFTKSVNPDIETADRLLREYFKARPVFITTSTYKPLAGVEVLTDERGVKTYYEYDLYGRLKCVKDHDRSVIEMYNYHYSNP